MRRAFPRLLPTLILVLAVALVERTISLLPFGIGDAGTLVATARASAPAEPPPAPKSDTAQTGKTPSSPVPTAANLAASKPADLQAAGTTGPKGKPPEASAPETLVDDLRARRDELMAGEAAVNQRAGLVAAAEKRVEARLSELTALQKQLEKLEADRKQHEEANWQGLVRTYEAMKPREAAAILNDMDMPVLLEVLDRMKELKAAQILGAMKPDRARDATAQLAELRTRHEAAPGGNNEGKP
jgi:flagellar motility protein MotE (MotC chaperone)